MSDSQIWLEGPFPKADPLAGVVAEVGPEIAAALGLPPAPDVSADDDPGRVALPAFPASAWRGLFSEYRAAMESATEASDGFHFAALWARCAVALGRRVHFSYGMNLYPNVYLLCFGPTGDRKTTATRRAAELGGPCKIIRGAGSGEGLADEFADAGPVEGLLLYAEEFSQVLRPGRWDGATLIPFLTNCFDCPEQFEMRFRKSPVKLERPTPSMLGGTTPDWFWQDFRIRDFQGGFGNRIFFFTGRQKADIPLPETPRLDAVSAAVGELAQSRSCEAQLDATARELWTEFYRAWRREESKRDPLLKDAVQRIPAYVLKLAMLYAASEKTLPEITGDQLTAAILVGRYGEKCVKELLSLQNSGTNVRKELERRILTYVDGQPGDRTKKRDIYRALARHYSDAEAFNRAFESLVRAGELFTKTAGKGSVDVSKEPLE
jgi:hypothetical protein